MPPLVGLHVVLFERSTTATVLALAATSMFRFALAAAAGADRLHPAVAVVPNTGGRLYGGSSSR